MVCSDKLNLIVHFGHFHQLTLQAVTLFIQTNYGGHKQE
jgi:hypothetical protein